MWSILSCLLWRYCQWSVHYPLEPIFQGRTGHNLLTKRELIATNILAALVTRDLTPAHQQHTPSTSSAHQIDITEALAIQEI